MANLCSGDNVVSRTINFLVDMMDYTTPDEFRKMKSQASVLIQELHRFQRNLHEHSSEDDRVENFVMNEAELTKIAAFKKVLSKVFSKETKLRQLLHDPFHHENYWENGKIDFRGDGRVSANPNQSSIRQRLSFLGDRREPEEQYVFQMELGEKTTDVFHYRSGIILRVDDHVDIGHLIEEVVKLLIDGSSIDAVEVEFLRAKIHQLLRRMFFPGDSVLSFFDLAADPYTSGLITVFHKKRWDAYFEYFGTSWNVVVENLRSYAKGRHLRWDDIVLTVGGPVKRCELELEFGMSKMRRQLEKRVTKAGESNGFQFQWIQDVFLKQNQVTDTVDVSNVIVVNLDSTNIFDDGVDYGSTSVHTASSAEGTGNQGSTSAGISLKKPDKAAKLNVTTTITGDFVPSAGAPLEITGNQGSTTAEVSSKKSDEAAKLPVTTTTSGDIVKSEVVEPISTSPASLTEPTLSGTSTSAKTTIAGMTQNKCSIKITSSPAITPQDKIEGVVHDLEMQTALNLTPGSITSTANITEKSSPVKQETNKRKRNDDIEEKRDVESVLESGVKKSKKRHTRDHKEGLSDRKKEKRSSKVEKKHATPKKVHSNSPKPAESSKVNKPLMADDDFKAKMEKMVAANVAKRVGPMNERIQKRLMNEQSESDSD